MSGSLRAPVPGQLSLLELLEHQADLADPHSRNHPNVTDSPERPDGSVALLTEPVADVGLGEWEVAVLGFAAEHHLTGGYDGRVEQHLGCSPTRYVQALAGLLDRPEALAAEPELVGRLRALRDRRQRLRTLARGSR